MNVEDRIVSVNEIFRLQDADEYSAAERLYLSGGPPRARGRAGGGRGRGLEAVTTDRPKVMLPIAGKPLLRWLVDAFKKESINDITVVGGYRADAIDTAGIKLVVNERYAETGELASLACAVDGLRADTVISYGDLLFRSYVLRDLVECEADFAVVVDSSRDHGASNRTRARFRLLLARPTIAGCSARRCAAAARCAQMTDPAARRRSSGPRPQGRWIGLLNVRRAGAASG